MYTLALLKPLTFIKRSRLNLFIFLFLSSVYVDLEARILPVGPGKTYANPASAAQVALAGDTILIFPADYTGGHFIGNLHGASGRLIYFMGTDKETVKFIGNSQAFHFSDVSYISIQNLTVTGQTGNGVNIDDGGTYDTPTHHVYIQNCIFRDMGAQGNNDLLKLSGVDSFEVRDCIFKNGAGGGSGIDMVGCHHGLFIHNYFENMGSNSIQAKGGTQHVFIAANWFVNGGQRTLNLGGSTGLQFFRPLNAPFEAADINVYSNVIIGSWAPIAYVGCVRVMVVNNTIVNPQNWIIRILQETVDPTRFLPCGQNSFVNNIVYFNNSLSRHVNIGPNVAENTFTFSNNLWYNSASPAQSTPQLPVAESQGITGENPLFVDLVNHDYSLKENSPAIDAGQSNIFTIDYRGYDRPSGSGFDIGAFEFQQNTTKTKDETTSGMTVFPSPFTTGLQIQNNTIAPFQASIRNIHGQNIAASPSLNPGESFFWDLSFLPRGMYLLEGKNEKKWVMKW